MGIRKKISDYFKLLAVSSAVPFINNMADRKLADYFLRARFYRPAFSIYKRTEYHANKNNLVFDELISLLKQKEIVDSHGAGDKMYPYIYQRLTYIEHTLDSTDEATTQLITAAYNYTHSDNIDSYLFPIVLDGYYNWFINESNKHNNHGNN